MKKSYATTLSALFIIGILALVYFTLMPQTVSNNVSLGEFSTQRAIAQIKNIAAKPHPVGSENHKAVADYLEKELQKLGLQTTIQEGTTFTDWGNLVKSKNILARIKGSNNTKALLLLSHYDSAPHSASYGASDNGSGVATILEGIRAFIYNKTPHKNDIIILFSDAEELGLNGAALFVTQNNWAKDVGLVLNFEARGTSGPSYMLMEVNNGNAAMVKAFTDANPKFPVSSSLMYSIYKLMPNDTDLTVIREQGKIQGFNFAFIDNHFNYHTAQDDYAHLRPTTVAHQGSYLMPLLNHFCKSDLAKLNATEDFVYFNTPFHFITYPFSWVFPMWIACVILLILLILVGVAKRVLLMREILVGFIPLLGTMFVSATLALLGWDSLQAIYPQYKDILQGFTYNGHDYIGAFAFLSLGVCFLCYKRPRVENAVMNQFIAPLFLWLVINLVIAYYLPGAGFFIIPVFFGLLMFGFYVITQKINRTLNLVLAIPALIILVPLIIQFPIGLGLKILSASAVLTVLIFGLLLPVFGMFSKKSLWATSMLLISIGFFTSAHFHSQYEPGKAKPNSLLYVYDADSNRASWVTYDVNLDEWTKAYLGDKPNKADGINRNVLYSKYNSGFTYMASAPLKNLPMPSIEFVSDSIMGNMRYLKINISPNRLVNRYDIFANQNSALYDLKANGATLIGKKNAITYLEKGKKVLSYYVVDNEPLELQFSIIKDDALDLDLMESSMDLMTNPLFSMAKRKDWMMPMPFVLNDAVVIQQKIMPTAKIVDETTAISMARTAIPNEPIPTPTDTIKQ